MIATFRAAGLAALASVALAAPAHAQESPAVGAEAPAFRLQDQAGKWHSLSDYRGKKVLLIVPDGTRTAPVGMMFKALILCSALAN